MNYPIFFNSKNSLNLFGLEADLNFLSSLYSKKKLPKVLMFTGDKGSGKQTLVNHFLYSIFDSNNYNKKSFALNGTSSFLKQFKNNVFSNIIYINGSDFKSVKVDDIRELKKKMFQSTILDHDRFIILNDIEIFNKNSLNALLKIIEEPTKNNYFFLINNKSKPILETIKSRSLEIKIILNEGQRIKIIKNLLITFNQEQVLDPKTSQLSPGNFVRFNYLCHEYKIDILNKLKENLPILLNLYKKNKDILFINFAFFVVDYYFNYLSKKKALRNDKIYEIKNFIFDNLNKFILYNINQSSLLNAMNEKLNYE
jgi:DNA polymerase-3 subunit delta'